MTETARPLPSGTGQPPSQNNHDSHNTNFLSFGQTTLDSVANALGKGKETKNGDGWLTCCPVHGDTNPSLSIMLSNGKLILNCHAGCDFGDSA